MKRALVFQHVPFEAIGSMAGWLEARGLPIQTVRLYAGEPVPSLSPDDLLIVMGGPMSVNDEAEFPWLTAEKRAVAEAVRRDQPVIGVCLGAQMIANALGARVYPNRHREIGWLPIHAMARAPGRSELFAFPDKLSVFHWHGETFDLPPGATLLASSEGCVNQAFQIGLRVIGLQFHLETTPETAARLIEHCRSEMTPGPYVQDEPTVRSAGSERYAAINREMARVLDHVTRSGVHP